MGGHGIVLKGSEEIGKFEVDDLNIVFLGVLQNFFRGHSDCLLCRVVKGAVMLVAAARNTKKGRLHDGS